jgi:hypothetical protein
LRVELDELFPGFGARHSVQVADWTACAFESYVNPPVGPGDQES